MEAKKAPTTAEVREALSQAVAVRDRPTHDNIDRAIHIAASADVAILECYALPLAEERDRLAAKNAGLVEHLKREIAKSEERRLTLALVETDAEGVWRWAGDGRDDPASLVCPVVMSAERLRGMLAERDALAAEVARLRTVIFGAYDPAHDCPVSEEECPMCHVRARCDRATSSRERWVLHDLREKAAKVRAEWAHWITAEECERVDMLGALDDLLTALGAKGE